MARVVQARVDEQTAALIEDLKVRTGWTDSEVVREGIQSLLERFVQGQKRTIAGLGEFDSGISDLGSNKEHLEGLGR